MTGRDGRGWEVSVAVRRCRIATGEGEHAEFRWCQRTSSVDWMETGGEIRTTLAIGRGKRGHSSSSTGGSRLKRLWWHELAGTALYLKSGLKNYNRLAVYVGGDGTEKKL